MRLIEKLSKYIQTEELIKVSMPVFYITNSLARDLRSSNQLINDGIYYSGLRGPFFKYNENESLRRNKYTYIRNILNPHNYTKTYLCSYYKDALRKLLPLVKTNNVEFYVKFTRNFSWSKGTFGDNNSCWFGSKSGARKMLSTHNGFAVQVFTAPDIPYGRCWGIIPERKYQYKNGIELDWENSIILFNGYKRGHLSPITRSNDSYTDFTLSFADMVSYVLNTRYSKAVTLTNDKYRTSGNFFINQNLGIILSDSRITGKKRFELGYEEEDWARCFKCRNMIDNDELVQVDDLTYCQHCAEIYLDMCYYDMNLYHIENMVIGPDNHKYAVRNIEKVPEFTTCYVRYNRYIIKSDKTYLGKMGGRDIYISEDIIKKYKICDCGQEVILMGQRCLREKQKIEMEKTEMEKTEHAEISWMEIDLRKFTHLPNYRCVVTPNSFTSNYAFTLTDIIEDVVEEIDDDDDVTIPF